MARPFGLEDDLGRLAIVGPAGGDAIGALGRSAVEQHHVGVAREGLVEPVPDQAMVVEVEPAGEGDLGAGGNERFGLDAAFGGEEVAAIDHRRGQCAVVDRGTGAWPPGRPGVRLEARGGCVAELFQALAPFDQGDALADQAFEFDRADFRAVLFLLAAFLRLLVGIERALDLGRSAMEAVDRRPEQLLEVGIETGVGKGSGQGVEDVVDGAVDGFVFGQRPHVGLAGARVVAVELQLV